MEFELTDEQAQRLERAAAGEAVDMSDDEAEIFSQIMKQQKSPVTKPTPPDMSKVKLPQSVTAQESLANIDPQWKSQVGPSTASSPVAGAVRAFGAGLLPGFTAAGGKLSEWLGETDENGDPVDANRYQQIVTRAVKEHPAAHAIGGMVQSIGMIPRGMANLGVGGMAKLGAAQATANHLTSQMNTDPDAPAGEVLLGAGLAGTIGGLTGGLAEKYFPTRSPADALALRVGPKAAQKVLEWTDSYARGGLVSPEEVARLELQPSLKGYANRYQDVLEEIATHVIPEGPLVAAGRSSMETRGASLANKTAAGDYLEAVREPLRQNVNYLEAGIPLAKKIREVQAQGGVGAQEAGGILKSKLDELVSNPMSKMDPSDPAWYGEFPLKNFEEASTQIRKPEYQQALKSGDPERATTIASDALRDVQYEVAADKSGMDPFALRAADQAASEKYATASKANEIVYGREAGISPEPTPGFATDSAAGMATRASIKMAGTKVTRGIIGGSKKALSWAMKRIQNAQQRGQQAHPTGQTPGGTLPATTDAPFQLQAFKKQVDAIDRMDPGDQSIAIYVMSMTDPVFAALWRKSQEDEDESVMGVQ